MPTCEVQMHTELDARYWMLDGIPRTTFITFAEHARRTQDEERESSPSKSSRQAIVNRERGFTLVELVVVIVMVSFFVLLPQLNLLKPFRKNVFRAQANKLVSAMQMAASAAAESDRKYEVLIDIPEQGFMLRQITTPDLSEVLEEEIIIQHNFNENCQIAYILFDDGDYTNESRAKFRAGRSGWQYGGKIVLLDEDQRPYTIIVNRINRIVTLLEGEVEIFMPRTKDELPF